jgi:hypothetical protein
MFTTSRLALVLLVTSAGISSFASAGNQGLRKKKLGDKKTYIANIHEGVDRQLSTSIHYSQMGAGIDGHTQDDALGKSVAISKDGLRVAIAAPGEESGKGVTRILDWEQSLQEWVQVGQDIVGLGAKDGLGWSMDMNEDGSRIVLGAPEANNDDGFMSVYELDSASNEWQLLGSEINPETGTKGQAGVDVAMSATGDRVAFGAPRTNGYMGRVSAFQLVSGQWVPLGQNIEGQNIDDDDYSDDYYSYYYTYPPYSGASIAMAADGNRLVIGGRRGSLSKGHITIYDYDGGSSQWVLNDQIDGQDYYDRFGGDVDISEDGSRIVVGAFTSDGQSAGLDDAGEVSIFEYDGSNWNILGQQIIGAAIKDRMGESVAISGDGTHIAVSSPQSDENGSNTGKVEVYKFSEVDQAWLPKGNDIVGDCKQDRFGEGGGAVALDHSGAHVAVGAQRGRNYYGISRVYEALAGAGDGTSGSTNNCV